MTLPSDAEHAAAEAVQDVMSGWVRRAFGMTRPTVPPNRLEREVAAAALTAGFGPLVQALLDALDRIAVLEATLVVWWHDPEHVPPEGAVRIVGELHAAYDAMRARENGAR